MIDLSRVQAREICGETGPSDDASLHRLSGLSSDEAAHLSEIWGTLSAADRRRLLVRLVALAERNFELDFGAVYRVALSDTDAQVRQSAVEGLWEDDDVRLVPSLVMCLTEDESPAVRAAAASVLGRFVLLGELGKIRPGPFGVAYEALLNCCRAEEEPEVWRRALESLSYVSNEDVNTLIEAGYADAQRTRRVSAIFAMGRSGHERWSDYVRRELFSADPEMRYEGARACGELALSAAVEDLEELTQDVDAEVREAAIWSLGQIGGNRARRVVERLSLSEDEATRVAAESALDEIEFAGGELSKVIESLARGGGS
jgi:HEAT repeat protein